MILREQKSLLRNQGTLLFKGQGKTISIPMMGEVIVHVGVSKNRAGPPKSSHFNRVFHYKPSILGVFFLFLETRNVVRWLFSG